MFFLYFKEKSGTYLGETFKAITLSKSATRYNKFIFKLLAAVTKQNCHQPQVSLELMAVKYQILTNSD